MIPKCGKNYTVAHFDVFCDLYCTDLLQQGIYMFYVMKRQKAINLDIIYVSVLQ